MQQLFLCHHRNDAHEIAEFAATLRLFGIRPWIDAEGGFLIGDSFVSEAKRVIRDDCFGMVIYATPEAFERPFVRRIELNEAIHRKERDPGFLLITVLRRMSVPQLAELSRRHLGFDLSVYQAHHLHEPDAAQGLTLRSQFEEVAGLILTRLLAMAKSWGSDHQSISLQYSTRELLPPLAEDVLTIDATRLFSDENTARDNVWPRVATALFTIKQQLAARYGRPRLVVHGSKHLTAATLFGQVFRSSSGFQIDVRHRNDIWATDCQAASTTGFELMEESGSYHTDSLFVEVSATGKPVRDAVRRYIQQTDKYPFLSLRFNLPPEPDSKNAIDNAQCCAMALQIAQRISLTVSHNDIAEVHLFGSVPQPLALMIGYHLNAVRPVQLYEYSNGSYIPSYRLPMDGR